MLFTYNLALITQQYLPQNRYRYTESSALQAQTASLVCYAQKEQETHQEMR